MHKKRIVKRKTAAVTAMAFKGDRTLKDYPEFDPSNRAESLFTFLKMKEKQRIKFERKRCKRLGKDFNQEWPAIKEKLVEEIYVAKEATSDIAETPVSTPVVEWREELHELGVEYLQYLLVAVRASEQAKRDVFNTCFYDGTATKTVEDHVIQSLVPRSFCKVLMLCKMLSSLDWRVVSHHAWKRRYGNTNIFEFLSEFLSTDSNAETMHKLCAGINQVGQETLGKTKMMIPLDLRPDSHIKYYDKSMAHAQMMCKHPDTKCGNCGCPSDVIKLMYCVGCRDAFYCNAKCQKVHWKKHKKVCTRIKRNTGKGRK